MVRLSWFKVHNDRALPAHKTTFYYLEPFWLDHYWGRYGHSKSNDDVIMTWQYNDGMKQEWVKVIPYTTPTYLPELLLRIHTWNLMIVLSVSHNIEWGAIQSLHVRQRTNNQQEKEQTQHLPTVPISCSLSLFAHTCQVAKRKPPLDGTKRTKNPFFKALLKRK